MKKELLNIEKEINHTKNGRKTQIMIGHTSRNVEDYLKSLKIRHNGKYDRQPNFIISKDGLVVETLKPKKESNFLVIRNR